MDDWELEQLRREYLDYFEHVANLDRREVVDGRPVEQLSLRSARDGALAFGAFFHIDRYLQDRPRGRSYRPSPAFLLRREPLTIRVPDVSFIETHRLAQNGSADIYAMAPDLVVEVLTDNERVLDVEQRIADFLTAGTRIAWLLDARNETVEVRYAGGETRVFVDNQKVRSAPLLPWLNLPVYELFGG